MAESADLASCCQARPAACRLCTECKPGRLAPELYRSSSNLIAAMHVQVGAAVEHWQHTWGKLSFSCSCSTTAAVSSAASVPGGKLSFPVRKLG